MSCIKKIKYICAAFCFACLPFTVCAEEEDIPLAAAPSPYDNPIQAEIMQIVEMIMANQESAARDLASFLQIKLSLSPKQENEFGERLVDDMMFLIESEVQGEPVPDFTAEKILNFEETLQDEQIVIWQTVKDSVRRIMEEEKLMRAELPVNNDIVIHSEAEAELYMKQNNVTPTSLFSPADDDVSIPNLNEEKSFKRPRIK